LNRIEATDLFLRAGQTVKLRAFGDSMIPAIRSGDALIVEAARAETLAVGDVVLVRAGLHLVAHRIAQIAPGPRFLLRDDRTGSEDGWFDAALMLGKVAAVERGGARRIVPYRPLRLAIRRVAGQLRAGVHGLVPGDG
jgi:hypothetical protein